MNVQYCKLQRTSTGVFPRAIRGNGLRVLVAPLRHVEVLFFRPYFVMVNYPTIATKKQVNLIVYRTPIRFPDTLIFSYICIFF